MYRAVNKRPVAPEMAEHTGQTLVAAGELAYC